MRARLINPQQANAWLNNAYVTLKPFLFAGHVYDITIKPETRSTAQSRKFHAICDDIAKSGLKWGGKTRSPAEWKVLLVSGHAVATNEGSDIVPGLEGEFINLRESTAAMSKRRGASLIEYSIAYALSNGVQLREPEHEYA